MKGASARVSNHAVEIFMESERWRPQLGPALAFAFLPLPQPIGLMSVCMALCLAWCLVYMKSFWWRRYIGISLGFVPRWVFPVCWEFRESIERLVQHTTSGYSLVGVQGTRSVFVCGRTSVARLLVTNCRWDCSRSGGVREDTAASPVTIFFSPAVWRLLQ